MYPMPYSTLHWYLPPNSHTEKRHREGSAVVYIVSKYIRSWSSRRSTYQCNRLIDLALRGSNESSTVEQD